MFLSYVTEEIGLGEAQRGCPASPAPHSWNEMHSFWHYALLPVQAGALTGWSTHWLEQVSRREMRMGAHITSKPKLIFLFNLHYSFHFHASLNCLGPGGPRYSSVKLSKKGNFKKFPAAFQQNGLLLSLSFLPKGKREQWVTSFLSYWNSFQNSPPSTEKSEIVWQVKPHFSELAVLDWSGSGHAYRRSSEYTGLTLHISYYCCFRWYWLCGLPSTYCILEDSIATCRVCFVVNTTPNHESETLDFCSSTILWPPCDLKKFLIPQKKQNCKLLRMLSTFWYILSPLKHQKTR